MDFQEQARRTAEQAARQSYGKLLSILAARNRDIAAAEDALADAFQTALKNWSINGVPHNPEAWLLTAARRNLQHRFRHQSVVTAADPDLSILFEERAECAAEPLTDKRLQLMFVCTHPAIDVSIQAQLMLQTVLGIDAGRIASSFLIETPAMSQRLVRAKAKIRDAGIAFEIPDAKQLPERLTAVQSAIYAAFNTGWDDTIVADGRYQGLAEEAIWLGRVLNHLVPNEPEVKGLLALMLYCHARVQARTDDHGNFVPLREQNHQLWSRDRIIEAENILVQASRLSKPGRFQIEAAIQSLHAQRAVTGQMNHTAMLGLYAWLAKLMPTTGVLVAEAAAYIDAEKPENAILLLERLRDRSANYQPFWATLGHAQKHLGQHREAYVSFQKAFDLSKSAAVKDYLQKQIRAVQTLSQ